MDFLHYLFDYLRSSDAGIIALISLIVSLVSSIFYDNLKKRQRDQFLDNRQSFHNLQNPKLSRIHVLPILKSIRLISTLFLLYVLILLSNGVINYINYNSSDPNLKAMGIVHVALLDGTQLSSFSEDINGNGTAELVVLNRDYTVTVYSMTDNDNHQLSIDNLTASACAMSFGDRFMESNVNAAVSCYIEAYRLSPNDESLSALITAYQNRSSVYESKGEISLAIDDARSAMELACNDETFSFYYGIMLRNAKNAHDSADAIVIWEEFAERNAEELTRFSANDRWKSDAAELHLAYAEELATQKDESCIDELCVASVLGADISTAVVEAESHFEPGLTLTRLRLMELDLLDANSDNAKKIRSKMTAEVLSALSDWKGCRVSPSDVPLLIRLADEQRINLRGIDRVLVFEEAALAYAGDVEQYSFVDWDADGYSELLTLDSMGILSIYGVDETWRVVSVYDTGLPDSSYMLSEKTAPLLLILSSSRDELLALSGTGYSLSFLFREGNLIRYREDGSTIYFSSMLDGSIARRADYRYEALGTDNRPIRIGIDWQQNEYPQPESAAETVQRYFEARAFDIPEEASLLIENSQTTSFFTVDRLIELASPDNLSTVSFSPYLEEDRQVLFEVNYSSSGVNTRSWLAVEYLDGWKLTGAAESYGASLNSDVVDYSLPLLCLNDETAGTIKTKDDLITYRVLVPSSGCLHLIWQSDSPYTITMLRESLTGDTVYSRSLASSSNRQQSKEIFISAGVYYVTIVANSSNAEPYHFTFNFEVNPNVELENNDVSVRATAIELNTGYLGTLSNSEDIDCYSFSLNVNAAVNISFGLPGNSGNKCTHAMKVYSMADGSEVSVVDVLGNKQFTKTGNLFLSAGTYIIQVEKGNTYSNATYTLAVYTCQYSIMEAEPNNTRETANIIPLNEDIHASIGREGDVDIYIFTLEEDSLVQPQLSFTPTNSSLKTYTLTIMDINRNVLLNESIGGKEYAKNIQPIALTAGKYLMAITNPRFVRQDYLVRLDKTTIESAEIEPNDSAAFATPLEIGHSRTGILVTDTDVDYYKLTFAEQTKVTLRFSFFQNQNTHTAFVLNIEHNGINRKTYNIKGNSGGTEQYLLFPSGEYYIRVNPSEWLGAVYTIEIE